METIAQAIESITVWNVAYAIIVMAFYCYIDSKIEIKTPEGTRLFKKTVINLGISGLLWLGVVFASSVFYVAMVDAWNLASKFF